MLTPEFIRHEIDAINEKWREIQKGSELQSSELFAQAASSSPLALSSANRPNSPTTVSLVQPFCRSLHACDRPIAGRDKSLPSMHRSPGFPFPASALGRSSHTFVPLKENILEHR